MKDKPKTCGKRCECGSEKFQGPYKARPVGGIREGGGISKQEHEYYECEKCGKRLYQ